MCDRIEKRNKLKTMNETSWDNSQLFAKKIYEKKKNETSPQKDEK